MKPPAFQFYADDFLSGTADMSPEEVGMYMRLLCHQWTKGGIPNDEERLRRMAGAIGSPSLGYVMAKFKKCEDGLLRNDRLERVRAEQDAFRQKQAISGKKGADARWNNGKPNGVAMATPMAKRWPDDGSPSPSPSPSPDSRKKNTLPEAPAKPVQARERNPIFDALAEIAGIPLNQITKSAAGQIATALRDIKAVSAEVTAGEIHRRAGHYRQHFKDATLSPTALAKWWGKCNDSPHLNGERARMGENLV